jgi:hypothetical protein
VSLVPQDKRRASRKPIRYFGWIATAEAGVMQRCLISDVSDTGARIDVQSIDRVPDRFTLLLTRNAKMRRVCEVIWRQGTGLGVRFDRRYR